MLIAVVAFELRRTSVYRGSALHSPVFNCCGLLSRVPGIFPGTILSRFAALMGNGKAAPGAHGGPDLRFVA